MFLRIVVMLTSFLVAYLLGSINFAILITKTFFNKNIKEIGSKNGGSTNVFLNFGKIPALLTLIGDSLKGFLAVAIAQLLCFKVLEFKTLLWFKYMVLIFAVIGHIFPIFHKFRGGKGIAVTAGGMIFVDIKIFITLLTIFIIILKFSKIVSLSSITTAFFLPIVTLIFNYFNNNFSTKITFTTTILNTIISIIIIFAHRENIRRILEKKETKILK